MLNKFRKQKRNVNNRRKADPYMMTKTVKGIAMRKILYAEDTITSVNGGLYPKFFTTSTVYFNLQSIFDTSLSVEYNDLRPEYQACRLINFQVEITRVISENTTQTLYTSGLPMLHLIYLPGYVNVAASNVTCIRNENALIVSPHIVNTVRKSYKAPNLQCIVLNSGVYYVMNPSIPFSTNFNGTFPGTLQVGWNATTAATADIPLFQFRILALCEFTIPA
jgi:hypothetical protein